MPDTRYIHVRFSAPQHKSGDDVSDRFIEEVVRDVVESAFKATHITALRDAQIEVEVNDAPRP